jgi:2-dehydropantoate 2-reductase
VKLLVVGTGVIGTIYRWALAEAGHDVTHLVRLEVYAERLRSGARV